MPNYTLINELGITLTKIKTAREDRRVGEGVTVIGYTLGLDKHFDEREWDRVITELDIF